MNKLNSIISAHEKPNEARAEIRIASWNIRDFSDRSRDASELEKICNVLVKYDMVAVVELLDEEILERAVRMLQWMGRRYDYEISPQVGRDDKERYAFLYDSTVFEVLTSGKVWFDGKDDFIREPYYATFKVGDFDFTIIVIHIRYGDKVSDPQREIRELGKVYRIIQDEDRNEQDVLLVGDFNRPPDDENYASLKNIQSMIHLFNLPDTTNIRNDKLYDNIWFQSTYVQEYTGEKGIDRFDETDFGNDDNTAESAVSDHRPVWAEFYTDRDDDGVGTVVP